MSQTETRTTRTEDLIHRVVYEELQPALRENERAITDARDFIYVALAYVHGARDAARPSADMVSQLAGRWLESYGGDARKDAKILPLGESS